MESSTVFRPMNVKRKLVVTIACLSVTSILIGLMLGTALWAKYGGVYLIDAHLGVHAMLVGGSVGLAIAPTVQYLNKIRRDFRALFRDDITLL